MSKPHKLLRDAGAQVVAKPAQHFQAPENWSDIDTCIERLQQGVYTWVAFFVANAAAFSVIVYLIATMRVPLFSTHSGGPGTAALSHMVCGLMWFQSPLTQNTWSSSWRQM